MPSSASRRMPLSCEPCRERKIRCPPIANRARGGPCDTCTRRGIPASECVYLRDMYPRRQTARPPVAQQQSSQEEMVARISRLEEMLRASVGARSELPRETPEAPMLSSGSNSQPRRDDARYSHFSRNESSPPGFPTPTSMSSSVGRLLQSESGHEHYEPLSSKWSSILDGDASTRALKTGLNVSRDDAQFPFTTNKATAEDLLNMLPPVSLCDKLRGVYFSVFAPLFHVLHDPSFNSEYALLQNEPDQVQLSWLALLFAILSVAVLAVEDGDPLLRELGRRETSAENMTFLSARYRTAAMQCLEADHYLWRHNLHTLQALIILIYGINHTHGQSWALLGTARNIALSLGCHVDPEAFDLGLVVAEERRRAWAGLNMLYTIQNTTLGNIESNQPASNVALPMDVNDDQLTPRVSHVQPPITGPSQMSYLLYKFRLYGICNRICHELFQPAHIPSYNAVLSLDGDITAQQDALNYKYLLDTTISELPDCHAAHLNILFGYSHQLVLLLHRPVLMQNRRRTGGSHYTDEQTFASQEKCIQSARALLGIHRMLHETESFRSYRWYNRGLGSFHAFHAAILLAHVCRSNINLSAEDTAGIRQTLRDALQIFEAMERSGLSKICRKATPVLRELLKLPEAILRPSVATDSAFTFSSSGQPSSASREERSLLGERGDLQALKSPALRFDILNETMETQQWLSPCLLNWDDWDSLIENNISGMTQVLL